MRWSDFVGEFVLIHGKRMHLKSSLSIMPVFESENF